MISAATISRPASQPRSIWIERLPLLSPAQNRLCPSGGHRPAPAVEAAADGVEADHVGAELRQRHPAQRGGDEGGALDHAQAVEDARHLAPPPPRSSSPAPAQRSAPGRTALTSARRLDQPVRASVLDHAARCAGRRPRTPGRGARSPPRRRSWRSRGSRAWRARRRSRSCARRRPSAGRAALPVASVCAVATLSVRRASSGAPVTVSPASTRNACAGLELVVIVGPGAAARSRSSRQPGGRVGDDLRLVERPAGSRRSRRRGRFRRRGRAAESSGSARSRAPARRARRWSGSRIATSPVAGAPGRRRFCLSPTISVRRTQRLAHEHRTREHQAAVEQVAAHALRRPRRLADRDVAHEVGMRERRSRPVTSRHSAASSASRNRSPASA